MNIWWAGKHFRVFYIQHILTKIFEWSIVLENHCTPWTHTQDTRPGRNLYSTDIGIIHTLDTARPGQHLSYGFEYDTMVENLHTLDNARPGQIQFLEL